MENLPQTCPNIFFPLLSLKTTIKYESRARQKPGDFFERFIRKRLPYKPGHILA